MSHWLSNLIGQPQRSQRMLAFQHGAIGSALTLMLCVSPAWAGEETVTELAMPQTVDDTSFASEREAVMWRQQT
ncbi:hypothetical protein HSBAA_32390 [Vreelandella sulfidaeris]|uniref:Uncharacterized protein n=1 Tax=Vreelandella sulfidaeris TaxID=115553 RepID=A0A455U9L0_9GAMM|nr:hypothetical protein HSBAA_32390 [Halomonas sulfidaeris]